MATLVPKVELPADHPGVGDLDYRARRDAIATISASYRSGAALPIVEYTPTEHEVWRTVSSALRPEMLPACKRSDRDNRLKTSAY